MAVALVVGGTVESSLSASPHTFAVDVGSGSNRLLLVQTRSISGTVSGVTYAGVSMSNVGSYNGLIMWALVAPTTGNNNVVVSWTGSSKCFTSYSAWTGVDQSTPLGTEDDATATSTNPKSSSITCPTNGAIFGGEYSGYSSSTPTIQSGTLLGAAKDSGGGQTKAGAYRTDTGTVGWTIGNAFWYCQTFPINAANGAAASSLVLPRLATRFAHMMVR